MYIILLFDSYTQLTYHATLHHMDTLCTTVLCDLYAPTYISAYTHTLNL